MSDHIEDILKLLSSKSYKPITEGEIRKQLGVKKNQRKGFYKDLKKLRRQKRIVRVAKDRYMLSTQRSQSNIIKGTLKRREGSFFIDSNGMEYRLSRLINPLSAVVGDEVIVRFERRRFGTAARVIKVVFRKHKRIIGYIKRQANIWILDPVDRKMDFVVRIQNSDECSLKEDSIALCEVVRYPDKGVLALGRIVKVYGNIDDGSIDRAVVIDKYNLPHIFNKEIENQLQSINEPNDKDFKGREDFRDLPTITIDGADAKDFDDAIDIEETKDSFKLFVHIADVSHYVKELSDLDKEAFARGFSVYFPGSVIPMLPHELSDNICSLVPNRDRLAVSVVIEFDKNGNRKGYRFTKSIIRNKNRMTYKAVQDILDDNLECDIEFKKRLIKMKRLAALLRKRRFANGSIDLNVPEPEFVMEEGNVVDIKERPRWFAHFLIEEFMLAANLCAADFLSKHFDKFIRRVHDEPDVKKIHQLTVLLKRFGIKYSFSEDGIKSKQIQKLIESIDDAKKNKIVSYLVLRSLKRAEYSTENKGHYALGFNNYTHFTSPIRRYSDLVVHRMIKSALSNISDVGFDLEVIAEGIRDRELVTEEAQFYMDDIKSAGFMSAHLGDEFEGTIVSIISSGIFIRLNRYFVEGFVAVDRMKDDYYEYKEELFSMIGKRTRKIYRIGDDVKVVVVSVNKFAGEVDFVFA